MVEFLECGDEVFVVYVVVDLFFFVVENGVGCMLYGVFYQVSQKFVQFGVVVGRFGEVIFFENVGVYVEVMVIFLYYDVCSYFVCFENVVFGMVDSYGFIDVVKGKGVSGIYFLVFFFFDQWKQIRCVVIYFVGVGEDKYCFWSIEFCRFQQVKCFFGIYVEIC